MIVTRKVIETPSNSKSPGASHHVDIQTVRFAATAEQRGTGVASADVPAGQAKISISGSYYTGQGARRRSVRQEVVTDVVVTGEQADTVTVTVDLGQRYTIQFWGVRANG